MSTYQEFTDRNIGVITQAEQDKLKCSCVAVFGVGGLGGVITEIICRSGIGHIKIIEPDSFDASNLNRHVFCYNSTLGRKKVDVAFENLKNINPDVIVEKYLTEDEKNIDDIFKGVNVVALAVDKVRACILTSRESRKRGIPLVEGWALPFGNVRVFTKDTLGLEEIYNLPSKGREIKDLNKEDFLKMDLLMLESLSSIEGIKSFYNDETLERIIVQRKNPSFAPLVWLTAVLMSLEVIKIILGKEKISLAPSFSLYDPFMQKIPKQTM